MCSSDTPAQKEHYPLHRVVGYEEGGDTVYEEIEVCAHCVPTYGVGVDLSEKT